MHFPAVGFGGRDFCILQKNLIFLKKRLDNRFEVCYTVIVVKHNIVF